MPRRLSFLLVLPILVLLAGCGGGDEDDVRKGMSGFFAATRSDDTKRFCDAVTSDTRKAVDRLGRLRGTGACAATLRKEDTPFLAVPRKDADDVNAGKITVDGDRATFSAGGDDFEMRREGDAWKVGALSLAGFGYPIQASVACGEIATEEISRPLPPATRAGIAKAFSQQADGQRALRRRLARLEPPETGRRQHRMALSGLARQARQLDAVAARVAGVGRILASVRRAQARLAAAGRRITVAQRRLDFECANPLSRPAGVRYTLRADRACAGPARAIANTPSEVSSLSAALSTLDRVISLSDRALRGLRRARPPRAVARKHREAVGALSSGVDVLRAQRRSLAAGQDPTSTIERLELRGVLSGIGFSQLRLSKCAQL